MTYPIPEVVLARHIAVLGETGSGKTHDTKSIVEHLVSKGYRVCVLDTIKSDWWGMISSANGKRAGLPFRILGGPRGHVPLHAGAGKAIGELVGKGKLPLSIIDMADFDAGEPQAFFEQFAKALWKNMKGVVYLVIEEAHEIAPKERAGFGKENMAVYWAKKLATGSRTKGIRLVICSQRTQAVHNALLGSCGTMIAHSLSLPADQKPVREWLDANIQDKSLNSEIKNDIAFLPTGTAWVVCARERVFFKLAFPKIDTFDNTATPDKDAADIHVATAAVDLDELRNTIGDAVKEAEANDPKTLKAALATANAELAKLRKAPPNAVEKINTEALDAAERRGFDKGVAAGKAATKAAIADAREAIQERESFVRTALLSLSDTTQIHLANLEKGIPAASFAATAKVADRGPAPELDPYPLGVQPIRKERAEGVTGTGQKVLNALRELEVMGCRTASREILAFMSGYSNLTSKGYANAIGALRTADLISYPSTGQVGLTDTGRRHADEPSHSISTAGIRQRVVEMLGGASAKILDPLIEAYPDAMSRESLAEAAGYGNLTSKGFANGIGRLRTLGFIDYPSKGDVVATTLLFPGGA